jgi:hypothetical protein
MRMPKDEKNIRIRIMFSKFLKYPKMVIFEKAFRIRFTNEKQIKNRNVIVPSLNFPFKRRGRKNLRKIINSTKYKTA